MTGPGNLTTALPFKSVFPFVIRVEDSCRNYHQASDEFDNIPLETYRNAVSSTVKTALRAGRKSGCDRQSPLRNGRLQPNLPFQPNLKALLTVCWAMARPV